MVGNQILTTTLSGVSGEDVPQKATEKKTAETQVVGWKQ